MRILVTGGTGLIGNAVIKTLVQRNVDRAGTETPIDEIVTLVRSRERAIKVCPESVALVVGDITVRDTIDKATDMVDVCIHCAGMPEQFVPERELFDRVNREGTKNVLESCLYNNVKRVIYTSTMNVFLAPQGGTLNETMHQLDLPTAMGDLPYPESKRLAEQECERFIKDHDMDIVFINPVSVYGPGSYSHTLNSTVCKYLNDDQSTLPPGGASLVFVGTVAAAHVAAIEKGKKGERYLLSDHYVGCQEALNLTRAAVRNIYGEKSKEALSLKDAKSLPLPISRFIGGFVSPWARMFNFESPVNQGQVEFLNWQVRVDSSKAERELGFVKTPVTDGFAALVQYLKEKNVIMKHLETQR
eukprot:TRINITY_DN4496_c0_g1_i1.p1 TRINITY_DN4496_c0_g1~~TRINITY_DN4496_c0_g1_i1.p1  ORF type:complete len:359 (-),score=69.11 TRINITY_DN4496_c0_g1_i1:191-1267(-)